MRVLAYCLMTNHYHLLVSCPEGGLSKFMHRVGSLYARHHNDRLGRDGPICRDRFRSLLIDSDEYLANAGRYIHRNPVDIRPQPALDEYPWSSYRHYVTDAPAPEWLSTSELLGPFTSAAGYRSVVESRLSGIPVDWAVDTAILELAMRSPREQSFAAPFCWRCSTGPTLRRPAGSRAGWPSRPLERKRWRCSECGGRSANVQT